MTTTDETNQLPFHKPARMSIVGNECIWKAILGEEKAVYSIEGVFEGHLGLLRKPRNGWMELLLHHR